MSIFASKESPLILGAVFIPIIKISAETSDLLTGVCDI